MKKLFLSISVVMLITSCGSKDEPVNEPKATTEASANEDKESAYSQHYRLQLF